MAALTTASRQDLCNEFQRLLSVVREPLNTNKADLQAAVNALDDFLVANASSINSAIPLPARTQLNSSQKARLLMFVISRRYVDGA